MIHDQCSMLSVDESFMKKLIVLIIFSVMFCLPVLVLAQTIPPATPPADDGTPPVLSGLNDAADAANLLGKDKEYKDASSTTLVQNKVGYFLNIIISFVGMLFFLLMLYGGFLFMTSAGDTGTLKKAKGYMIYSAIGVIVIVLSYAGTNFIIATLGKNF